MFLNDENQFQILEEGTTDYLNICDALRDLVPFVPFKKREKNPQRSVTFSKVAD